MRGERLAKKKTEITRDEEKRELSTVLFCFLVFCFVSGVCM